MVFRAVSYYVSWGGPEWSSGGDVYDIFDERHKNKLFKFNLREISCDASLMPGRKLLWALIARARASWLRNFNGNRRLQALRVLLRHHKCWREKIIFLISSAGDNTAAISRRNTSTASHSSTLFRCLFYPSVFITFLTCR